jgi:hypothetical protein
MTRCFAVINLLAILGFAAPALAEPPPAQTELGTVRTTGATIRRSSVLPLIVNNAHRQISSHLKVVLFEDDISGASAAVQLTPILPGCKLGLTYRF